ncbi:hypothetical protein ACEWY4_020979 [Coilia grayii]|uniref:Beta-1,3-galactosyl-O-glycosyl-glycoprotein beta-1,6-N-acetylglucosaminyltransferase 3 n=1 Tax=Coilia grayii TaxID=363190 RepID=A0ABD1J909_9TELE
MALERTWLWERKEKVMVILILTALTFTSWKLSKQVKMNKMSSRSVELLNSHGDHGEEQACLVIIRGDVEGVAEEELSRLSRRRARKALPESFYLNATQDCCTLIKDRGFAATTFSEEERDFPIAYSMVIHEKIEMFERLLRAIYAPQNVYCVHVDKKAPEDFMKAVEAIVSCFPNVFVASKLESVVYASWSRVQADLNCINDLLNSTVKWKYLLNTCGTDFPIKTNAEIVRSLKVLNGKNNLESVPPTRQKRARYEFRYEVTESGVETRRIRKTPPPISTPMFSGSAYFVLSREFVEQLRKNPEAKALLEWVKDTYSPDEHLWATLQRMPSLPGSNPPSVLYDTSAMIAIARLVKWNFLVGDVNEGAPYPRCAGIHRRGVCVYGVGDLRWMLGQQHLFANKFDPEVDDNAITCLEHYLHNKATDHTT